MTSPWLKYLQDYWWLAVTLVTIAGSIFRMGYVMHKLETRFKQTEVNQQALLDKNNALAEAVDNLSHRTDHLEQCVQDHNRVQATQIAGINRNINSLRRRDNAVMRATFAVLDGLSQLKCNGAVTEAHKELRKYILPIEQKEEEVDV